MSNHAPGTHCAYLVAILFWCISLHLSLVFKTRDMYQQCPNQFYTLYQKFQQGIVPQGNHSKMFQIFNGCMACLPTLMKLHELHATLYNTCDFKFLSKDDFRAGKHIFLVLQIIWISNSFFSPKIWAMSTLFWTKNIVLSSLLLGLIIVLLTTFWQYWKTSQMKSGCQ